MADGAAKPDLLLAEYLAWLVDLDLRRRCPLADADGRNGLVAWCLARGVAIYPALGRVYRDAAWLPEQLLPDAHGAVTAPLGRRVLSLLSAVEAPAVEDATSVARRLLPWLATFCSDGLPAHVPLHLALCEPEPGLLQRHECSAIDRLMALVWRSRDDLRTAFDLETAAGRLGFIQWYLGHGAAETGIAPSLIDGARARLASPTTAVSGELDWGGPPSVAADLIWRARSDLAVAFDRRTPAGRRAFGAWVSQHGVREYPDLLRLPLGRPTPWARPAPACAETVAVGNDLGVLDRLDPSTVLACLDPASRPVRLWCGTPLDTVRAALKAEASDDAPSIVWWGLLHADWPPAWQPVTALVDRVWVTSEQARRTTSEAGIDAAVVPLPVAPNPAPGIGRRRFGLPADRFLFLCEVDLGSCLWRQNPAGAIHAFRLAFAEEDGVGLVVRLAGFDAERSGALADITDGVTGVHVFADALTDGEADALLVVCDAYVSLHRAVTFGRRVGEAMALGRPAIVTAYGGTTEFATPDTAFLIPFTLAPVYDEACELDTLWAEPDIESAAAVLRRLACDPTSARRQGERAKAAMQQHHAPDVVANYFHRIPHLGRCAAKTVGRYILLQ